MPAGNFPVLILIGVSSVAPLLLKDWLISVKVPRLVRDRLPLLVAGDHIVWVPGVRVGQQFIITGQTQRMMKLIFRKA